MTTDNLKTTTLRIKETYMQEIKHLAVDKKTTQTELINKYIKQGLINDGITLNE